MTKNHIKKIMFNVFVKWAVRNIDIIEPGNTLHLNEYTIFIDKRAATDIKRWIAKYLDERSLTKTPKEEIILANPERH